MSSDKTRVLFVCLGNICRSPQAEAIFRHKVRARGLEARYEIDSCGTGGYHVGDPPDARSAAEAKRRGVSMDGLIARQLERGDLARFDLVVCMDRRYNRVNALQHARSEAEAAKVRLMREFEPGADPRAPADVPDPYYGEGDGFRRVFEILDRSCEGLLEHLEQTRAA